MILCKLANQDSNILLSSLRLGKRLHLCRGYNIGIRLIDEFLAKSKTTKCVDFKDTADKVARVPVDCSCQTVAVLL